MILKAVMRRSSRLNGTLRSATAQKAALSSRKRSPKTEDQENRKRIKSEIIDHSTNDNQKEEDYESDEPDEKQSPHTKPSLGDRKYKAWSKDAHASPFPDFPHPTEPACRQSHRILEALHGDTVRKNFEYTENPEMYYPYVMDALIVATLSQATSWSNAKRAMKSMDGVYGSAFAYQKILDGGEDKLRDALRPGGMQNRKAKMVMQILRDVRERHGKWDLNHLFDVSDDDAVKELISYKGVGPKSAFCILSICLQRESFAVDTHIYRIAGLWGWRPKTATREKAQAHLDARIPNDIKFALHYLLIVHGRECPVCRGNGNAKARCEYREKLKQDSGAVE